ncbi:MAG: DUF1572 domain-containing protein [Ignavibacteria bacterium]|nr:DUF1572 domain-containing protein [Ignavibacteria bacterium]
MESIKNLFSSYLNQLRQEIVLFKNDEDIWLTAGDVKNSSGTLAIHICGNLMHNIGTVLGKTGYVRNRESEFIKKISRDEVISEIDHTREIVIPILENRSSEELLKEFPDNSHGENATVIYVLMKIAMHMSYHIGQVNYLRRTL